MTKRDRIYDNEDYVCVMGIDIVYNRSKVCMYD